jgi:hypothetical protein
MLECPEHVLHDFQVGACGEGECGRSVPEVTEPDRRQSGRNQDLLPRARPRLPHAARAVQVVRRRRTPTTGKVTLERVYS